jgi:conflict system pore-forming effector with SLATT domain
MNDAQPEEAAANSIVQRDVTQEGLKWPDIYVPKLQVYKLSWKSPGEIEASINMLYQYAEATASEAVDWYGRHKRRIAWKSRLLRFLAILLTALGGLTPIISALGWSTVELPPWAAKLNVGQLGYLFLGLAAACVGLDRFFGFSSGWMRYITTKMALERLISDFRMDWAMLIAKLGNQSPTADQVQLMIQRIKEFLLTLDKHVEQETEAWVSEFKTNISEIEKTAKTQGEATRPGAISITVTNGMDTEDGFTVTLDGMEVKKVRGTKYQIGYVPPGPHKIAVAGVIKGEQLDASELVNVLPSEIASVTLALPVKEAQP